MEKTLQCYENKRKNNEEQHQRYLETKRGSLRDSILQMWGEKKRTEDKRDGKW